MNLLDDRIVTIAIPSGGPVVERTHQPTPARRVRAFFAAMIAAGIFAVAATTWLWYLFGVLLLDFAGSLLAVVPYTEIGVSGEIPATS